MPKTLFAKLAIGLLFLLGTIGILYAVFSITAIRTYSGHLQQELYRDLARNIVAERNLVEQGRLDERALKETFDLYMTINPGIEIYLLDLEGNILSHSAAPDKIRRHQVSLTPIKRFLAEDAVLPLLGDDPRSMDRHKPFSLTPVPTADAPEGYLYVVLSGEKYEAAEGAIWVRYVLKMTGWSLLISLGIGLLVGIVVIRMVTQRLRRLAGVMTAFERSAFTGDLRYADAGTAASDEINALGIAFDRMADEIRRQIEIHRKRDVLRRRLVAQISHDLRSPLASAQGYLESLQMKQETMSKDEKDQFLAIALNKIKLLEKLVRELFELAALEADDKKIDPEPFALNELVSDVVQKHVATAEADDKTIYLSTTRDIPFVYGDVGATERVLDNLLENAIAFSPAGGRIDVRTSIEDGFAVVEVEDDGEGIAPGDLPYLFEPFFITGKAEWNGHHAGLGLAIAKRLMELQHGSIETVSTAGRAGATFRFRMPLHDG